MLIVICTNDYKSVCQGFTVIAYNQGAWNYNFVRKLNPVEDIIKFI